MIDRPEFEMPDRMDEEDHYIVGDYILFVGVYYDECVPNPLEDWDETGAIYSFSNRHGNYWKPVAHCYSSADLAEALEDSFGDDWVPLGYFEHGRCDWHISGEIPFGTEGDYHWDGTRFAGIWVPDKGLLEYVKDMEGQERQDKLREYARQACDVYTDWCNGEVYGYRVEVYRDRSPYDRLSDYRHHAPEFDDSCWGYFGWDDFENDVKAAFERALDEIEEWTAEMEAEYAAEADAEVA